MPDMITLPDAETMINRLCAVVDEPHIKAGLYSKMTRYAGETMTPEGVQLALMLAMADYTADLPPIMFAALDIAFPNLLLALTGASDA